MPRVAIVAALQREVSGLLRGANRVEREYEGRTAAFYEHDGTVIICGGIGAEPARRAAEAVIALYHPAILLSAGFAGALDTRLHVGDIFVPAIVVDARDNSRVEVEGGNGILLTFMTVAGAQQKEKLAASYGAQAVDMEAAVVGAAARAHGIPFRATKVISDEFQFEIPETSRFVDPHGNFSTPGFILFAALRPWLWWRVAVLARNSAKAAKSLSEHLKGFYQASSNLAEANIR
jgi:adenosylhomocysteine nucleosidase